MNKGYQSIYDVPDFFDVLRMRQYDGLVPIRPVYLKEDPQHLRFNNAEVRESIYRELLQEQFRHKEEKQKKQQEETEMENKKMNMTIFHLGIWYAEFHSTIDLIIKTKSQNEDIQNSKEIDMVLKKIESITDEIYEYIENL